MIRARARSFFVSLMATRPTVTSLTVALIVATSILLSAPNVAQAADIIVNTTDTPIVNDVFCGLLEAIIAANTDAAGNGCLTAGQGAPIVDVIHLSNATYSVLSVNNGVNGSNGIPSITSAIFIEGNGASIQRGVGTSFRLFHIANTGKLTLDNVILMNGSAVSGGAIYNSGILTISTSAILSNTASSNGGAIFDNGLSTTITGTRTFSNTSQANGGALYGLQITLTLTNATFYDNISMFDGGAIALENSTFRATRNFIYSNKAGLKGGGIRLLDTISAITNTQIFSNSALTGGGGINNEQDSELYMSGSAIRDNEAAFGGGLANTDSAATLDGVTIISNKALTSDGGGISSDTGVVTITNSTILSNTTVGQGGALGNYDGSTSLISSSDLMQNDAGAGGGAIYNDSSVITLTTVKLYENESGNEGGAIYQRAGASTTIVNSEIFTNSSAAFGGGVRNVDSTLVITDSVVAWNYAATDGGGGISNSGDNALLEVHGGVVQENRAHYGGGIYNIFGESRLVQSEFLLNEATGGSGGGLFNDFSSIVWITDTNFFSNTADDNGGGIYNDNVSFLHVKSVEITGNEADTGGGIGNIDNAILRIDDALIDNNLARLGGGIYDSDTSIITFTNSTIITNTATESGGGLYVDKSSVILLNSHVISNLAESDGGGLYVTNVSTATLLTSELLANQATIGGGLFSENSITLLDNSTVANNLAEYGAGLYNEEGGRMRVSKSVVTGNMAEHSGGGLYNYQNGNLDISNSDFTLNGAGVNGGGVANYDATATVLESFILTNTAGQDGGGFYNNTATASVTETNFISNSATYGGGFYNTTIATATLTASALNSNLAVLNGGGFFNFNDSTATIANTNILANHAGQMGGGVYVVSSTTSISGTDIASNIAPIGGGINISATSTTIVTGSRILANIAVSDGGALFQEDENSITEVTESCIVNNSDTAVRSFDDGVIVATDNWWGAPDGPKGVGPGVGDSVSTDVDFSNFKTAVILACPTVVAEMAVSKIVTPSGSVMPGQPLTYTITIANMGDEELLNAFVKDTLPIGIQATTVITNGATFNTQNGGYVIPSLASNASATLTFIGEVASTLTSNQLLTNTVTLSHSIAGIQQASVSNQVIVPTLRWSAATYSANEASDDFTAMVILSPTNPYTSVTALATLSGQASVPLTFPPNNGSQPVLIDLGNDDVEVGTRAITLGLQSLVGAQLGNPATAILTVTDDESAGVVVAPLTIDIGDFNGSGQVSVTLTSAPTSTVSVTFTADNNRCAVSPNPLILDADNWDVSTTVTITAINNAPNSGDMICTLTVTTASSDPHYHNLPSQAVVVNIATGDPIGLVLSKSANVGTAHVGDTITYTYRITNTGVARLETISANDDKLGALDELDDALAPNTARSTTRTYLVTEADLLSTPLVNTVTVTGTSAISGTVIISDIVSVVIEATVQEPGVHLPAIKKGN